ncbi:nuclear pore complex protein Nup155-like [Gigantopelta aegis]|uniref:nuclear pore complex protein Nup155-like n=1 Tax=Gigantopelta aegis TaxID=1735272 RepID=UPI001B889713|nr:nuclear pore complex protein Nup155-like [Gigantopelta aegis]
MASILDIGLPPLTHQDILESASRLVDKHLAEDRNYLDPSELLKIPSHSQPTVSGLHDFDYPNMMEAGMSPDSLAEFVSSKRTPLPPLVVQEFGRVQCNFLMGLFPEIERAWLTIDSDIYVWKYEDGSDLAFFDGLNETILSTGLVKPKPGIFQPCVQYLLVLATPVDIVLLGVSFIKPFEGSLAGHVEDEMHLLPDPLFSIPTDNTYFTFICGTDNGRIFMAGKDGCLYEMVYQATDGWFSQKCRKINHSTSKFSFLVPSILNFTFSEDDPLAQICVDNSRNILYTRSEKGTIHVYDLGTEGKDMTKVTALSSSSILQTASTIARTIERSHFESVVHISALTKSDSVNIHLVAITKSGVRLYFTTTPFGSPARRPCMLNLVHIRLPPGFSASSVTTRLTHNVHMAYYKKGSLLLVASQGEENDLLWGVSSDSFPFQKQLMETQSVLPVDGKTKAIFEVAGQTTVLTEKRQLIVPRPDPPAVVTQHVDPPRKFIVLTSQGCNILTKLRPVEQLHQLLIDCQGPEAEEVKAFFRLHKSEHAAWAASPAWFWHVQSDNSGGLSWCRPHASQHRAGAGHMPANIGPASYASGGMGMHTPGSLSSTVVFSPNIHAGSSFGPVASPMPGMQPTHMSTPAHGMMHGYGQSMYPTGVASLPGHMQEVIFSGKHNGICIYLSRLLRPFWDYNVCSEYHCQTSLGPASYLGSAFNGQELTMTLELVRDLADFVDLNSKFESSGPMDSTMSMMHFQPRMMGHMDENTKKRLHAEALKIEKISLQHIQDLLHRIEEIFGLWKVLVDHQFHAVAEVLPKDQQNQLRTMSFKQLVVTGKEICSSLISCLIKRYLDDNASIDSISTKLRQTCPSLYSVNDAMCSRANELLHAARINPNEVERKQQLLETLKLYKEVTMPLQLPAVCKQFVGVSFFEGIIELTLAVAKKCDPHNLALHYYQSGEPPEDLQGMQVYMQRMECYSCVTNTLAYLWSASISHPQVTSVPKTSGPPPAPDPTRITAAEADKYKNRILDLGLKSDDALFHSALYDWLFATNNTEKLLEIQTPFIEAYLKRKAQIHSDNVDALDMLWKYYEKIQNFPAAAKILSSLADRYGLDVPLQQRIEYLSRAIMCAKSSTSRISSAAGGEFLHELEEKMEVARLQLQVQKAMCKLPMNPEIDEALSRLNSELVDITTLYEEFADKFDLPESKLAIVHCAGLCDSALIENLWQNIIDKEISSLTRTSPQTQVKTLSHRMIAITKLYASSERYFPVAFIVKYLEQKSCELNFDPNWVFRALLDVGTHPEKLLEIYDRMFKSRDPYWQQDQKLRHLLIVLHGFLSHFADNPTLITERRRFATRCLDAVSSYLVELQAMSSTDDNIKHLILNFKQLQAKLDRLRSVTF